MVNFAYIILQQKTMKVRVFLSITLFFAFILSAQVVSAQSDMPKVKKEKKKKGQSQEDLDKMNSEVEGQRMTKEQKKNIKALKKTKKQKEKNDKITRKRAQKISSKRLNKAKSKVGKKKK